MDAHGRGGESPSREKGVERGTPDADMSAYGAPASADYPTYRRYQCVPMVMGTWVASMRLVAGRYAGSTTVTSCSTYSSRQA